MIRKYILKKFDNPAFTYLRTSAIFLVLSLMSALINYLYYPVIARFLGVEDFGATQALIAVALQISAVFAGLNLVTIYLVHELPEQQAKKTIGILQKMTVWLFIVGSLLVSIFHTPIMHFLNIDKSLYLFLVSLNLFTSIPFIIAFGYLQARKRFVIAGCLQLTIVSIKLLLGPLLAHKIGVSGALAAIAIGQVAGMIIFWLIGKTTHIRLWDHKILHSLTPPSLKELAYIQPKFVAIGGIFTVNVVLALFISFDIIAARHYFIASVSGLYAGASTLSNGIIFIALPLIGVLLPNLNVKGLSRSTRHLAQTASYIALAATLALGVFTIVPGFILSFFGNEYRSIAYLLPWLGVVMTLVSFITLSYQVGAFYAPVRTALLGVIGFCGLLAAVLGHHATPKELVSTIIVLFATILLIGVVNLIWIYSREQKTVIQA